ncbi:B3 domain-containing protein Os11g0197600-like isoform X2 [Triticum dicoccoides]|uniref:B3 domain-containing protein Os11g0197600-like isoform X2 n=1 Tax=Triticum dicoccoides TaxID=85692 RepID=UPI000E7B1DBC|nr:B3 domain-containing protein Os11g0197600-like isoform X2 [Triticum dicoccoides]
MVRHKKQYNTMGVVDNMQNVKVKEEEDENINMKGKRKQNKAEGGKKAEEKQNSSKRKMDKNKEEKEKRMRVVDKNDDEKEREDRSKRKENEKKVKSHIERKEDNDNKKEEQGQREIEKDKVEEEKEINKQKGRKEEEDSKEKDKDQNDKTNCPHFFRTLISYSFMEHMTIPVGFHKYLEDCTGMVSLRGPSGNKWSVELAKISGELLFARGWKEFLSDNRIGYGYLLVFRYDGQSQFSVTIFLPSSCEDPYAYLARPQCKDVDWHQCTNVDGVAPQEEDTHSGTSADGAPQNEASEEEDASEDEDAEEVEDALSETPGNEEDSECRMCNDDALEPVQQQQEDLRKTDDGFLIGKRARFRKVDDIMAEVDRSKKSKPAERKNSEGPSSDPTSGGGASSDSLAESEHRPPKKSKAGEIRSPFGDSPSKAATSSDNFAELDSHPSKESKAEGKSSAPPLIVYTGSSSSASKSVPLKKASKETISNDNLAVHTGVFAPESVCTDLTMWHNSFGKRLSKQNQFPMFNKSNGENQPGRVLIKVMRRLGLMSQRRPVTQREKEYAMERAHRFKSERPFAIKAMKHNDVYASYFMIIPDKFVKTFLPKESRKMTLWDPQAKPWKVWYEYTGGERPRAAFSAGWGALAMENNLEKWDVCVFELLDQEYNIKLHVHKVVLMITPCILAPKPRIDE